MYITLQVSIHLLVYQSISPRIYHAYWLTTVECLTVHGVVPLLNTCSRESIICFPRDRLALLMLW